MYRRADELAIEISFTRHWFIRSLPVYDVYLGTQSLPRDSLQVQGLLDPTLCLLKGSDGTVLLPIAPSRLSQLDLHSLQTAVPPDGCCELAWSQVVKDLTVLRCNKHQTLQDVGICTVSVTGSSAVKEGER